MTRQGGSSTSKSNTASLMWRACSICGVRIPALANRCELHAKPAKNITYGRSYRQARAQVLAEETACWICGLPAKPGDQLVCDHVLPRALGGPSTRANLRAAHRSCNGRRGQELGQSRLVWPQ
jgi:hypothetical protein